MDYMTADEMAEAKHKADMDDKMKAMIREILFYVVQCGLLLQWRGQVLFYVVLLFFLLVVINGQHDNNSYLQNHNVAALFNKYLHKHVSAAPICRTTMSPRCSTSTSTKTSVLLCALSLYRHLVHVLM